MYREQKMQSFALLAVVLLVAVSCHGYGINRGSRCKSNKNCRNGYICQNRRCKKIKINVCSDQQDYEIKYCPAVRPTPETCPLPSFAPPGLAPAFCGVTITGERFSFRPPECQVCQNPEVLYYFNKPCYDAPFTCEGSQRCNSYYCSAICQSSEQCPYDWQICNANRCQDACIAMRCAAGPCKFGKCNYQPNPLASCQYPDGNRFSGQCPEEGLSCYSFHCVNECDRTRCQPYQKCVNGSCQDQ